MSSQDEMSQYNSLIRETHKLTEIAMSLQLKVTKMRHEAQKAQQQRLKQERAKYQELVSKLIRLDF